MILCGSNIKRGLTFFYLVLSLSIVKSQQPSKQKNKNVQFLPSVHIRSLYPVSIHPDNYNVRLSRTGNKWRNMIGVQAPILAVNQKQISASFAVEGFIELHDFQEDQLLSWQMWRGNIGLNSFWEWAPLNAATPNRWQRSFLLEFGWDHESQHVTDTENFFREFQNEEVSELMNPTLRSFEYIKWKLHTCFQSPNSNWSFYGVIGTRIFFNPIHDDILRENKVSTSLEIGIHRHLTSMINIYSHYFYEYISHDQNTLSNLLTRFPLQYRIWEGGIGIRNDQHRLLSIFFTYSDSNGRGIDYVRTYQEFGWGLRIRI